jgi:hypothetical protein
MFMYVNHCSCKVHKDFASHAISLIAFIFRTQKYFAIMDLSKRIFSYL